jgi:hypothetical protein
MSLKYKLVYFATIWAKRMMKEGLMPGDFQQAKDDIAFIKGFLGSSGRAPVAVGHFYLLAGVVFFLYALRQFCLDMDWQLPSILTAYKPWDTLGLFLIGFGVSSTVMWRQCQWVPDNPKDLNPAARAALSAWGAVSFATVVGVFSLWLSSGIEALPGAGMILLAVCYSTGWSVTHTVHRIGWHKLVAWGFVVWALAIGASADSPWLALVLALGLLLLFALPGYRIIQEANEARRVGARD